MTGPGPSVSDGFEESRDRFEAMAAWLSGDDANGLDHAELEVRLDVEGRELLRRLFQDHPDLRARRESRIERIVDADGVGRETVEGGHRRGLATVFGDVEVDRLAYRRRGHANLHPADAALNLPDQRHSHGLRRLAAIEATRGSFDDAVDAIGRASGQQLGKRQVEDLAQRAAADFDEFYATRAHTAGNDGDVLVLSCDGKGIVMRPEALRPATAKAAAAGTTKLETRLSKGEKRNRKRMAEVGAVYTVVPVSRAATDVLASGDGTGERKAAPTAKDKWLTASVLDDAATVVAAVFDEAERRDPTHQRPWVALVDGNNHQIDRIHAEAARRELNVTTIMDFIHVLEYLWRAAWSFYAEGDPAAEAWVHDKAIAMLDGKASIVALSLIHI